MFLTGLRIYVKRLPGAISLIACDDSGVIYTYIYMYIESPCARETGLPPLVSSRDNYTGVI